MCIASSGWYFPRTSEALGELHASRLKTHILLLQSIEIRSKSSDLIVLVGDLSLDGLNCP